MRTKRQPIKPEQRIEVVERYQNLETMIDIAKSLNMTRQGVFKVLKKAGIDTTKGQRIKRTCPVCGVEILRVRCRARNINTSYCSAECYRSYLESLGETYKPSGYYSRVARETITKYFDYHPEEGHILHHINKDCSDNRKINLMVFANQGDHVRFHRGIQVTPIWSGLANTA